MWLEWMDHSWWPLIALDSHMHTLHGSHVKCKKVPGFISSLPLPQLPATPIACTFLYYWWCLASGEGSPRRKKSLEPPWRAWLAQEMPAFRPRCKNFSSVLDSRFSLIPTSPILPPKYLSKPSLFSTTTATTKGQERHSNNLTIQQSSIRDTLGMQLTWNHLCAKHRAKYLIHTLSLNSGHNPLGGYYYPRITDERTTSQGC